MLFTFISTNKTGIKTTFGKLTKECKPGLHFYVPFFQYIDVVNNFVEQDTFNLQIKTHDNVFAKIKVAVQHQIKPEDSGKAYFSLSDPVEQINSYVESEIRSIVQTMTFDKLYASTDDICNKVSTKLSERMSSYGYTIINTLVTDIDPSKDIKDAMNKIIASERLKQASINEADAEYIKSVKQAEADKQRKKLQGEGMAEQRKAILDGYNNSIKLLSDDLGIPSSEILDFVKTTQHLDTMETIGKSPNVKTVFLNHQPDSKLRNMLLESRE
jgi:regulator of protease activity HflC (stomatin/prohibitin superfamily)